MDNISLKELNEARINKLKDYLNLIEKEWQNDLPLNKLLIKDMIEILENMERSN